MPNNPTKRTFWQRIHVDIPLVIGLLALMMLGLAVLYSASGENHQQVIRQMVRLGVAFAVIYKVSSTVHDRYGSDMFPMHAIRWVLRPVAVDGSTCTGWKGEPTVLFRTGSKHALPPSLATMA